MKSMFTRNVQYTNFWRRFCVTAFRFERAHNWDRKYTIPHVFWDTLPRASTSQIHPHLHVTLARDQYYGEYCQLFLQTLLVILVTMSFFTLSATWNHLYVAAKKYAEEHNGENYFSVLTKVTPLLLLSLLSNHAERIINFFVTII